MLKIFKIVLYIVLFSLIFSFSACNSIPPDNTVKSFFDSIKKKDFTTAVSYLSTSDDSVLSFDTKEQEEIINRIYEKLGYEIISSKVEKDTAIVKTKITSPDLVKITGQVIIELMPQLLELAFSNEGNVEDQTTELTLKLFDEYLSKPDLSLVAKEIDIKLIKDHTKKTWVIEPNDDLINAMTGNAYDAFKQLQNPGQQSTQTNESQQEIAAGINDKARVCVEDSADLLDSPEEEKLNNFLIEYEQKSTVQLALKTVESLNGESIEEYSLKIANEWRLGNKGTNNGALFVLSDKDREFRLELGYGLEWCIKQNISDEIIRKMTPYLKEKRYYEGFKVGFDEIIKYTQDLSWNTKYTDIGKAVSDKENSLNEIVSFLPKDIKTNENVIVAASSDGYEIEVKTTNNMGELIKQMGNGACTITGRIKSIQPISIELLSVTE